PAGSHGFGNTQEAEALAGALPRHQNTPLPAPYGLYAEHLSGTGFTAVRHENRKAWFYRLRPSAQHRPFSPLAHATFTTERLPPDPNLAAWPAPPIPEVPTDWVDGLHT